MSISRFATIRGFQYFQTVGRKSEVARKVLLLYPQALQSSA